jgi:hypothetical protein
MISPACLSVCVVSHCPSVCVSVSFCLCLLPPPKTSEQIGTIYEVQLGGHDTERDFDPIIFNPVA